MPQNETIEVTDQNGVKMALEVSWESDIWAWARTFRVILKWLEFPEMTVDKVLPKDVDLSEQE